MSASLLLPRDVTNKGNVGDGVWLIGIVTRRRVRAPATFDNAGKGEKSGKGKGKARGRGAKKEVPREGLEVHLCGGSTPADVILLEAWAPDVRLRFEPFSHLGKCIKVSNIEIKEHSDKTFPWTTSRLQVYGQLQSTSLIENFEARPEWLTYHPVTPVDALQHIPDGRLVCVAGRVLPGGPEKKNELVGGERVDITNFRIRHEDGIVDVSAWRENAAKPIELKVGQLYYFSAIKKITQKGGDRSNVALRYVSITEQTDCPQALHDQLDEVTSSDATGATSWSKMGPGGAQKDYQKEDAQWFSLSVCETLMTGQQNRQLATVAQVPSVLVSLLGDSVTYLACKTCGKGVQAGVKSCSCSTADTEPRWKAKLRLIDASGILVGTCFAAMESFAQIAFQSEGDDAWLSPHHYHEQPMHVQTLMTALGAIPFTLLLSFHSSDFSPSLEAQIRAADPTFHPDPMCLRHPKKQILRSVGDAPCCPPCKLEDTSFNEGAGITIVPGGSAECFRALLEIADKPPNAERESDTSPACRVSRKVLCALRPNGDTSTHVVTLTGPINVVTRFLAPRKAEFIHAVLTWRSADALTLLAFTAMQGPPEEISAFKELFALEVNLHESPDAAGKDAPLSFPPELTPVRKSQAASDAASAMATPEPWAKRSRAL